MSSIADDGPTVSSFLVTRKERVQQAAMLPDKYIKVLYWWESKMLAILLPELLSSGVEKFELDLAFI